MTPKNLKLKRYFQDWCGNTVAADDGEYVLASDVAELEKKLEAAEAELAAMRKKAAP